MKLHRLAWTLMVVAATAPAQLRAQQHLPATVRSPDTRITVRLAQNEAGQLTYAIDRNGETVHALSALRLRLVEGDVSSVDVRQVNPRSADQVHKLVATKAAEARDHFNELTVEVTPRQGSVRTLQWIFRAYDDGVAFRYRIPADAGLKTLSVRGEEPAAARLESAEPRRRSEVGRRSCAGRREDREGGR